MHQRQKDRSEPVPDHVVEIQTELQSVKTGQSASGVHTSLHRKLAALSSKVT